MEKNKELKKLFEMAKSRKGAPRLVIGVKTPLEVREALLKADRGEIKRGVGAGIHVLMERPQRDALNRLAASIDLNAAETIRLLVRAAAILGPKGVATFADAANRMETANLATKFKNSKKKRCAINNLHEREVDEDES